MRNQTSTIYGGHNPLELPAYSYTEVARYLHLPVATVRSWCLGQRYQTASGEKFAKRLIPVADPQTPALSFRNLVEIHVLSAIRRKHGVNMPAVRKAIDYLKRHLDLQSPLSDQQMTTDGKDLFIERYGELLNISQDGQVEIKNVVSQYLKRIKRDATGIPIRLFPYTRPDIKDAPKSVAIDPRVQFGRPCIAGTGIPTSVIAERYKAGDSIAELAKDYDQETLAIEEAIRCEFETRAA